MNMPPSPTPFRAELQAAPLRIHGNLSTLELAPVLLAVAANPAAWSLAQGGVMGLYGRPGDLPNLAATGVSDVATNSETQGLRYSIAHPDLRIILTVSLGLYRIVARRSAGVRQLSDLRGKRVATMPRTSSAYHLDHSLRQVGLSEADVDVVPFVAGSDRPLSGITQAFLDGRIDAATVWEPELQKAQNALGADAVEFHDPQGYKEQFCLYSTAGKLADPVLRPRIVAFVREVVEASRRLRACPEPAWPLLAQATGQDREILAQCWRHHAYPASLSDDLLQVMVEEEAWVARESGRAPRDRAAISTLIDASVLHEATAPANAANDAVFPGVELPD